MRESFRQIVKDLDNLGFYRTNSPVVLHHLRKDFEDYDVIKDTYFILPFGDDFIHVAVVLCRDVVNRMYIQVRYCIAADDLLFGLRVKFNQGDPTDCYGTMAKIAEMVEDPEEASYDQWAAKYIHNQLYIRKRFNKATRTKAKVRATFVMFRETWAKWFS